VLLFFSFVLLPASGFASFTLSRPPGFRNSREGAPCGSTFEEGGLVRLVFMAAIAGPCLQNLAGVPLPFLFDFTAWRDVRTRKLFLAEHRPPPRAPAAERCGFSAIQPFFSWICPGFFHV